MSARRAFALCTALGLLAGLALAIALRPDPTPLPQSQLLAVGGPTAARPIRPPGESPVEIRPGSVRLALRVADPSANAPWAIRILERRWRPSQPARGTATAPWSRCAQLGRLVGGQFGWITDHHGFAPVAPEEVGGVAEACATVRALRGRRPATALVTTVRRDVAGRPQPSRVVAFGVLSDRGRGATLLDRGRPSQAVTRDRAFLAFGPADPGVRDLRLRLTFDGLASIDRDLTGIVGPTELPNLDRRYQGTPQLGQERIVNRAPDPAGGPPFGLLAVPSSRRGRWCLGSATRIVGRRGGTLDQSLDLFRAQQGGFFCGDDRHPLTRQRPVTLSSMTTGAIPGEETSQGRVQRRSLPGTTIVYGQARRDVRTIEIATSRDLRTLRPDPTARTFITAYDGNLPGEQIEIIATLTDGTRRHVRVPQ